MRQIGDEYRHDPFKAIGTSAIDNKALSNKMAVEHAAYANNTFAERAHNYCTKKTADLSSSEFSDQEASNFKNCLV